ncbi:MAG: DUF4325 domain-containing protein [Pseudoclavibacter sp.]
MAIDSGLSIGAAARRLGITVPRLRALTDSGKISATRSAGGHRRYRAERLDAEWARLQAPARDTRPVQELFRETAPLHNGDVPLHEDELWTAASHALPATITPEARRILAYAATEMLNNAIEHSRGTQVELALAARDGGTSIITVRDDGIGAFAAVAEHFGLPRIEDAILEIVKGKRTTAPAAHTGEGIFFTSQAVDVFRLEANGLLLLCDNRMQPPDIAGGISEQHQGTRVTLELDITSTRRLADVFDRFTSGDDLAFDRTSIVVHLARLDGAFLSRSEARRIAAGLERFARAEIDFVGVDFVGQAFIDELFRVWARTHPGTALVPTHANRAVAMMLRHGGVRVGAAEVDATERGTAGMDAPEANGPGEA